MKILARNIGFGMAVGGLLFMTIAAMLMYLDRTSGIRHMLEKFFLTINHPIESVMDIDDNEMLKGIFVYLMWWSGIGGLAAFLFNMLNRLWGGKIGAGGKS